MRKMPRMNGAQCQFDTAKSWFMLARNSALLRTFSRRLMSSSMASTGESGLRTLRRIPDALEVFLGDEQLFLTVPER